MPRKPTTIEVGADPALDRILARGISTLAPLTPPWLLLGVADATAAVTHYLWHDPVATAWAGVGLTTGTLTLTSLTWLVSHERRGLIGRIHSTLTTFLAGGWVTAATITGPTNRILTGMLLIGGGALALSWNIRHVIRGGDAEGGHRDALAELFARSHDTHGLTARTRTVGDHKIHGTLELPAGQKTVDDVAKKSEYLEGSLGLPPGTVSVAADTDRADRAHLTISDPRIMRTAIGWPGPSRPGASIADPIRIGVWQDLDEAHYTLIGHHLQVMGMTGSGKSYGAAWNYLGEAITRHDVAVFAADITKGEQTLGALRPALHRLETTRTGVINLINDVHSQLQTRTNHLASAGLTKWQPGCGLAYWILWLEEAPDILDAIDTDKLLTLVKALRSAGGSLILSLQRADYSQMPTIARSQLAKWCFGVADADDADFGLTDLQSKRGARPELWQNQQPGMSYLDAPTIGDDRKAMPLRAYAYALADTDYIPTMRAHAATYPATAKATDPTTAFVTSRATPTTGADAGTGAAATTGGAASPAAAPVVDEPHDQADTVNADTDPRQDEDVRSAVSDYQRTPDPNPDNTAGADDPITDTGYDTWQFTPGPTPAVKLDAAAARQALLDHLATWAGEGRIRFASRDLRPFLEQVGRTRKWAQHQYRELITEGVISDYDETTGTYQILTIPTHAA